MFASISAPGSLAALAIGAVGMNMGRARASHDGAHVRDLARDCSSSGKRAAFTCRRYGLILELRAVADLAHPQKIFRC
jgi:hypothetical protein